MQWYFWVILLVAMIAFTALMKYALNARIYYFIISMISNTKSVKILDKIKNDKFWRWLSKLGIFLGFGLFGILSWYWKDIKDKKRFTTYHIIFYSIVVLGLGFVFGNFGIFKDSLFFYFLNVIIFFLFGFAGFGILLLGYQAALIIKGYILGRVSCPGVAPVIPGITVPGTDFKIPFFEGWLALIMIMVVHELAHGILARKIGVSVKSFGVLLLGFFPIGAFTEPDEKELKESKPKDQLLVYSSGPTVNLLFALIVLLLSLGIGFLAAGFISNVQNDSADGIYLTELSEYTGMCNLGVTSENYNALNPLYLQLDTNKELFFKQYTAKIVELDNNKINNRFDFTNTLASAVDANKDNVNVLLLVQDLNKNVSIDYNLNLQINSDNSLGIKSVALSKENYDYGFGYLLLMFVLVTMQWTYLLSFMVGLFNYIPIVPLDGGAMLPHMVGEFMPKTKKEKKAKVIKIVKWTIIVLFLSLLVINALPLFI